MDLFQKDVTFTIKDKISFLNAAISVVILFILIYQNANRALVNYQLKKDDTVVAGESMQSFCKYTFSNLINEKFSPLSMDEVIYKYFLNDPSPFGFNDDEYVKEVIPGNDQCRVITVSQNGVRGFLLTLNSGVGNPLFYKITAINEEEDPKASKE